MKAFLATAMLAVTLTVAAPLGFAQTTTTSTTTTMSAPATTSTTTATTTTPDAAPPAAATTTTTTTHSSTTTTQSGMSVGTADSSGGHSCRTRHAAGESCSCVSAPTTMGTSQEQNGHNMCVVP